jgi:hypothetical protein
VFNFRYGATDSKDEVPTPDKRLKKRESKEEATERRHRERLGV